MLERTFENSSFIKKADWNDSNPDNPTLTVYFLSGGEKVFNQITRELFEEFCGAESKGKFYHKLLNKRPMVDLRQKYYNFIANKKSQNEEKQEGARNVTQNCESPIKKGQEAEKGRQTSF